MLSILISSLWDDCIFLPLVNWTVAKVWFFCDPMVFLGLLHVCLHLIQDNYGFLGAGGNKKLSLLNNISD